MRIYPPVDIEEMTAYLTAHAKVIWAEELPVSEEVLKTVAEALVMIGAVEVPEDIEPLFP